MMQTRTTVSRWNCGKAILFEPENPFAPRDAVFEEAWHAQVLAIADTMVNAGHFSAELWAKTLGAELEKAELNGEPDTTETYYAAALLALESLTTQQTPVRQQELANRKKAWESAYENTPHGRPVRLGAGD